MKSLKLYLIESISDLYATLDEEAFDDDRVHVSFTLKSTDDILVFKQIGATHITWDPKEDWANEELKAGEYAIEDWISEILQLGRGIEDRSDFIDSVEHLPEDDTTEDLKDEIEKMLSIETPRAWTAKKDEKTGVWWALLDIRNKATNDFSRKYIFIKIRPLFKNKWFTERLYKESQRAEIPSHIRSKLLNKLGLKEEISVD